LIPEYPELLRTSLLKCDVEGYELFVFKGAQQILSKARPVVILEIGNFEKQGYSAREVHTFFEERHYESFAMAGKDELVATNAWLDHDRAMSVNRVLIPAEKIEGIRDLVRPGVQATSG
jgi:hypothetical protein